MQLGLRNRAYDYFDLEDTDGGELEYKTDVRDDYKRLDAGLVAGMGYKVRKQIKSTAIGINYYYGLMNVSTLPDTKIKNSSLYLYVRIPIGTIPKEEKTEK